MRRLAIGLTLFALTVGVGAASAQEFTIPKEHWSFGGVFGIFDRAAQQRGFQIYKEVCSACHPLTYLSYRNLAEIGFDEENIRAIAAAAEVQDGPNDQGEMFTRPGRPSDPFAKPYANDKAARAANNGALPPDLSMIVSARPGGPNYVYGILTGYKDPPANVKLMDGMNYNETFPGHQIAMPPPLSENSVTYQDGTPATLPQEAHDIVTFLAWASEPEKEERKQLGWKVVLFLVVLTGMLYASKRKVWADVH